MRDLFKKDGRMWYWLLSLKGSKLLLVYNQLKTLVDMIVLCRVVIAVTISGGVPEYMWVILWSLILLESG